MSLKKFNTLSVLVENNSNSNSAIMSTSTSASMNNTSSSNYKSSSSPSSNSSSNSPNTSAKNNDNKQHQSPASMSLLNELLPNMIESAAAAASSSSSNTASSYAAYCAVNNLATSNQLPVELKTKLYTIFNQIEKEFDSLYTQNLKLQQQLQHQQNVSTQSNINASIITNTSSTSTLVPTNKINDSPKTTKTTTATSAASSQQILRPPMNINLPEHKAAAKSTAKSRINNLSFPKFKPNAKEFIMQSIKNTSQQIVSKTQNHGHSNLFNSKLQCTLTGHKDGIWDINCQPIPNHLLTSSNLNQNNHNLLLGTASADTTARLWFFNSHLNNNNNSSNSPSASTTTASSSSTSTWQSTAFCIQEYCGHTGSVNSIRFHPKFFTDSTNLILTAGGDCQAHIWQCVLSSSPDSFNSSLESISYSNCFSFAMNQNNSTSNDLLSNTSVIRSPIKRYQGHSDACIAAEWFPDGELLVTASWDRMANVYNVETGSILCNLQHDDYLTNVSIHRMNKIILTSSKDTTFKVWDFRDPICTVNVYQGHNRSVNSAIFVNDDKIATASDDQTVKLWDLRIMRSPVCTINVNSGVNRICSICLNNSNSNSEETYLGLPLDNRDIKIYNLSGERVLRVTRNDSVGHRRLVTSLACYNSLLFSASFDKQINCWSIDSVPSKSSLSNSSNKQLVSNNKENNSSSNDQDKSFDNNNNNNNNGSFIMRSASPPISSNNQHQSVISSSSLTGSFLLNSNAASQLPLNALINQTNNNTSSVKGININSLTKFAERIKI